MNTVRNTAEGRVLTISNSVRYLLGLSQSATAIGPPHPTSISNPFTAGGKRFSDGSLDPLVAEAGSIRLRLSGSEFSSLSTVVSQTPPAISPSISRVIG